MKPKPIKILVMSVGEYEKNYTTKYLVKIGAKEHVTVCLPKQYEDNAESYRREGGVDVYVYDEKKYINGDFEFFGFKPRNCGGVGRQGIAEATEKYGDDYLIYQLDDDYLSFGIRDGVYKKEKVIRRWEHLEAIIRLFDEFYENTGIEIAARVGSVLKKDTFSTRKIFNNFIMRKGNDLNFFGFKALCSDDQRFNLMRNIWQCTPQLSLTRIIIHFHQNQGDRNDGNAPMYNGDCSWKKAFSLKMMFPAGVRVFCNNEENRRLFREYIEPSKIYPPITLV